jgi:hypothetical protein
VRSGDVRGARQAGPRTTLRWAPAGMLRGLSQNVQTGYYTASEVRVDRNPPPMIGRSGWVPRCARGPEPASGSRTMLRTVRPAGQRTADRILTGWIFRSVSTRHGRSQGDRQGQQQPSCSGLRHQPSEGGCVVPERAQENRHDLWSTIGDHARSPIRGIANPCRRAALADEEGAVATWLESDTAREPPTLLARRIVRWEGLRISRSPATRLAFHRTSDCSGY